MLLLVLMAIAGWLSLTAFLLACLIGGRAVLVATGELRWSVAGCLGLLFACALPALFGGVISSLPLAMLASAALTLGLALWLRSPQLFSWPRLRWPQDRLDLLFLALAAGVFALMTAVTWRHTAYDEHWMHFAVVGSLARDVLPAEHPLYPGAPFRYHLGIDVLAACVMRATGLRVEAAIDVAKMPAILLLLVTAAEVGEVVGGKWGRRLGPLLVPLASSPLMFTLEPLLDPYRWKASFVPQPWLPARVPLTVTSFYQHPMGVAIPPTLAYLVLAGRSVHEGGPRHFAVQAVFLGLLSLCHVVFFLIALASTGLMVVARALRDRAPRWLLVRAAWLSLAGIVALLLGGFFSLPPAPPSSNRLIFGEHFFAYTGPGLALFQHAYAFGFLVLLLPAALLRARREPHLVRTFALLAGSLGFVVANLFVYSGSLDIRKFFSVGMVFFAISLLDVLCGWLARGGWRRHAATAIVILSVLPSVLWLVRMGPLDGRLGYPALEFGTVRTSAREVLAALEPHLGPRDRVLTTTTHLSRVGIHTPGLDPMKVGGRGYLLNFDEMRRRVDHHARAVRDLAATDLDALGITYVVFTERELARLSDEGRAVLANPSRFRLLREVRTRDGRYQIHARVETGTASR